MNVQRVLPTGKNVIDRVLTNKKLLSGLEKLSEHGGSFAAATSLLMTVGVRPAVIYLTPDVEKENKQYAMANSMGSGIIKFGMIEAIALPLEMLVKKIDKNPEGFLSPKTIEKLKGKEKDLLNSRSYRLITQVMKLSAGFITAIPKSILTVALIPVIMDKVFNNKIEKKVEVLAQPQIQTDRYNLLNNKGVFFSGRISNSLTKGISGVINNKKVQDIAIKYESKDKDIAKHMTAGTDILLTATTCQQTYTSDRIKEHRKKALIYNNIISTAVTLVGGYGLDEVIKSKSTRFMDYFKKLNANDPKLLKYIEGINILRPTLIFAGIYYGILPIFSTYISEKIDKHIK